MLLAIVCSEAECENAERLFHNLLNASKDQDNAHHIKNTLPNESPIDIADSIPDDANAQWDELMQAIGELNAMKKYVDSTASELMRKVTEATITSDIDAIRTVDEHKTEFEDSSRLTDACSLAKTIQDLTDTFVENAHDRYTQFTGVVIPKFAIINDVLNGLTVDSVGSVERKQQMIEAIQKIRAITQRMKEDTNDLKDGLINQVEELAMELESAWQNTFQDLNQLLKKQAH